MEKFDIFQDISERTGGSVYIGIVGPVRTGKSTFIKRFMDLMVMPHITDNFVRDRTRDELPQSGAGKTIMTTEPKFVPDEPVELVMQGTIKFRVRLVDCVGYAVEGARGYEEEGAPRMVRTPWFEDPIPFEQAAEIGTRKVVTEHSTLALVVTTDGSITEIPRESYIPAEERVIRELKELGKPFMVVLNSTQPYSKNTVKLAAELAEKHNVTVLPMDCLNMSPGDLSELLHKVLYEFPVKQIGFRFPDWVDELEQDHWLAEKFRDSAFAVADKISRLRDVQTAIESLDGCDFLERADLKSMELGTGTAVIEMLARKQLYYQVMKEMTGFEVEGDHHVLRLMKELAVAKKNYDKVAAALADVNQKGYGIVPPDMTDIVFSEPEVIKHGRQIGVRLRATAPSVHMIRADLETEVAPFVGTEKQGEEMVRYLSKELENDPQKIWSSDFLGKSLHDLVREGLQGKLHRMPDNAQVKLQQTLTKIVNEGSGGLICIIL